MRETETHIYFWGGWLSNFHPCKVILFNKEWPSSEHAYMASKAHVFGDKESFEKILKASSPKEAKIIGKEVKGFIKEVWDQPEFSFSFMKQAIRSKMFYNEKLFKKLQGTGNKILVEASPYDKIWGVGLHETNDLILDEKNWLGENKLGKALMDIREEFRMVIPPIGKRIIILE